VVNSCLADSPINLAGSGWVLALSMLDNLPGAPDIDEMGNIRPAGLTPGWLALGLPALTLVGHGTVLLLLIV
jgi:hypothetical protein